MRRLFPPLAGFVVFLAILLLIAGDRAALHDLIHAQSSPSMSIGLSPSHSVPPGTEITATITLSNLDVNSYTSLTFRADVTQWGYAKDNCEGEGIGEDIQIDVDETREVFTAKISDACPIGGSYVLRAKISDISTSTPVELASARESFVVSKYLVAGVPTATPPEPGAQAWMDPDPRTLDMYANGEWRLFRFRSNVQLYLNDHLGVQAYGSELDHFVAPGEATPGEATPGITVEEACKDPNLTYVNWRRAINQSLWIAACKPGEAIIRLIHETDGVEPLYLYNIRTLAKDGVPNLPEITITAGTSPVTERMDAEFTLTRSGETTEALTVNVRVTETGSMLSDSRPSTVTFGAGDSSATLAVHTDDDSVVEDASVVTAELRADTNSPPEYTVGAADTATLTVNDNDATSPPPPQTLPTVSYRSAAYTVREGSSVTITVTLSPAADRTVTVPITVTADSAESGDYTVAGLTGNALTFDVGDSSRSFTISAHEDSDTDNETVDLGFGTLSDASVGAQSTATVTITDNDSANDDGGGSGGGGSSGGGSSGGGGGGGASRRTVTPRVIVFSPESLSFTAVEGGDNPPSQTLEVWNDEKGEMDFRVTDKRPVAVPVPLVRNIGRTARCDRDNRVGGCVRPGSGLVQRDHTANRQRHRKLAAASARDPDRGVARVCQGKGVAQPGNGDRDARLRRPDGRPRGRGVRGRGHRGGEAGCRVADRAAR